MPDKLTHPTTEELSAFSLGQLPPQEAAAIEAHITDCQPCCETLLGVSDEDTFVGLLREADQASGDATVDLNLATSSGPREDAADIPSSLLDHARYRVVGLVGRGGMGDVYKAEHRVMERTVALKVINRDLISKPEAVQRFHREVRAAARLTHPNIVTAYDAEQAGDVHFLAMEFVDGTELSEIVNQCGPLPVDEAVDYIRQAAAGLQHAHEMGMVHRDIKPQNLMLDTSGNVKILDFGLANFATESVAEVVGEDASDSAQSAQVLHHLTQLGTMMGTPDYIAPEQARDARSADIRSDIYSMGCTLYYLLAGKVPFPGDSVLDKLEAHAAGNSRPMHELRSDLPEGLEDVLQKMISQEPGDRFQTPAEVSAALQPYVGAIETKSRLAKAAGAGNRNRFRWIAAAAAAALLCGTIVVITDRGRIEIQSDMDDIEVVVSQGGRQVRVLDVVSGTSVYWLPSGDYQVAARGDGTANVTIGPETVTIARFGKELVRIQPDAAAQDKQRAVARPEIRDELMSLIDAARPDLTDEQLKLVLTKHTPLLGEMDIATGRAFVSVLTGLPNEAHQALLREGYLKWQFKSLDAKRQMAMQTFLSHLLAPTEKMGFPAGTAESGVKLLDKGNVGFAVLTVPDSTTQFVVWYLLMSHSPVPIMFPLVGVDEKMGNVMANRSLHDQLFALVDKPYSDLPTVNPPLSEQPAGTLIQNAGFEEASDHEGAQAANWLAINKTTASEPEADCHRDRAVSKSGDASAAIVKERVDNPLAEAGFMQNLTELPAGETLRLTGQIKTRDVDGAVAIKLRLRDPSKKPSKGFFGMCETPAVNGTVDWRRYEALIQIPKGAVGELSLVLQGTGKVWFDDIQLITLPPPESLLINGGFDEVAAGHPAGWTAVGADTSVQLKADDEITRSGAASATIINDGDDGEPYNWRQEITIFHVGDAVSLTGWVKTKDASMAAVAVQVLDTDGQMIAFHTTQNQTNFPETSDWRSFTLRFSIPKKTARLAVLAMLAGRGQVWFDDFEMKTELSTIPQDP